MYRGRDGCRILMLSIKSIYRIRIDVLSVRLSEQRTVVLFTLCIIDGRFPANHNHITDNNHNIILIALVFN